MAQKPSAKSGSDNKASGAAQKSGSAQKTAHNADKITKNTKTAQAHASQVKPPHNQEKVLPTSAAKRTDAKSQNLRSQPSLTRQQDPNIAPAQALKNTTRDMEQAAKKQDLSYSDNQQTSLEPDDGGEALRRTAGPARARIAANDDLPSIGGLIFALQQRPSNRAFLVALISSIVWAGIGALMSWSVFGELFSKAQTAQDYFLNPAIIGVAATIIIPIALFWFLALLSWRAQELRLMSSAMTEVAVRLAEPDQMAEQSVASLGQTVRRQVAAMNDAIARALGRAGELEALVHNEVAALERSYSDNELRIRSLIDELASEREALANNSERVSSALRGVGSEVTHALADATSTIAHSLSVKGETVTSALTAVGTAIDDKLLQQGSKITEQIASQSAQTITKLQDAGENVTATLKDSTDRTTALITAQGNSLVTSLSSMNQQIGKDVPQLLNRLGGEQQRLDNIIKGAVTNLSNVENALAERTDRIEQTIGYRSEQLQTIITQHVQSIDTALVAKTKAIDSAFANRIKQLDDSFDQQALIIDQALQERTKSIALTLTEQAVLIDETFMRGLEAFRITTDNMANESVNSIEALASQAQLMKEVSEGLLRQVDGLTTRFESQNHAILQSAQSLENTQGRIDTVLENRQSTLNHLLEDISSKTNDLDSMMTSYSGQLENSLQSAQSRAQQITNSIAQHSETGSQAALHELEKLRNNTQKYAAQSVDELKNQFSTITGDITRQINSLTSQFTQSTKDARDRTFQAVGELETMQDEIQSKINKLPNTTRQSAIAMRRALSDQLRAIETLSGLAHQHDTARDLSAPQGPAALGHPQAVNAPQVNAARPTPAVGQIPAQQRGSYSDSSRIAAQLASHINPSSLSGKGQPQRPSQPQPAPQQGGQYAQTPPSPSHANPAGPNVSGNQWSMGDLLERASTQSGQNGASRGLNMNALAGALDNNTAAHIWQRYQNGEQGIFNRGLYTPQGQSTFDEIFNRYRQDGEFKQTVDRYLLDFERLLREVGQKDPSGRQLQNYLMSETGRVYLLLAHASGRIG